MSPMMLAALSPGQMFFVQVLGFAILVGVLLKLAIPALGKTLGARSQGIEDTFKKIDLDTQETSKKLAEMKEKVARLTEESKSRLDAALADAAIGDIFKIQACLNRGSASSATANVILIGHTAS